MWINRLFQKPENLTNKLNQLEEQLNPLLTEFYAQELNQLEITIPPPPGEKPLPAKNLIISPTMKLVVVSLILLAIIATPLFNYLFSYEVIANSLIEKSISGLATSYAEEEGYLWAKLLTLDKENRLLLQKRLADFSFKDITVAYLLSQRIEDRPIELLAQRKQGISWVQIIRGYHLPPIKTLLSLRKETQELVRILKEQPLLVEGSVMEANSTDNNFSLNTFPFLVNFKGILPQKGEEVLIEVKKDNGNFKTETLKLKLKETQKPIPLKVEGKVAKVDTQKGVFYLENQTIPISTDELPKKGEKIKTRGVLKGVVIEITDNIP